MILNLQMSRTVTFFIFVHFTLKSIQSAAARFTVILFGASRLISDQPSSSDAQSV